MTQEQFANMKPWEMTSVSSSNLTYEVLAVPGGWIFTPFHLGHAVSSVFVPNNIGREVHVDARALNEAYRYSPKWKGEDTP